MAKRANAGPSVSTEEALARWKALTGDRDTCVLEFSTMPAPPTTPPPSEVSIVVACTISRSKRPGTPRTRRRVRLRATDVRRWTFDGSTFDHQPDDAIRPPTAGSGDNPIELVFCVPSRVELGYGSIAYEDLGNVDDRVPYNVNLRFVRFESTEPILPPEMWITFLARDGFDAVWRTYGGEPLDPKTLEASSLQGHYLQERTRLEHPAGMFFSTVVEHWNDHAVIELSDQGADARFRKAVLHLAGGGAKKVRTGDCVFDGRGWHTYMLTGDTSLGHGE